LGQTETKKQKKVRKAIRHLNNCQRPEEEWSEVFWIYTPPSEEKVGEEVEKSVERISEEYKNRTRRKYPNFDPNQAEIEILNVTRLSWGEFCVVYRLTIPPCQECKNAREVLRENSLTYLSVVDGWAEEKFKEMTGKGGILET